MSVRTLHVLLFAPALLLGQGALQTKSVPEDVLFNFFFRHISSSESQAKSKGKSDSSVKQTLKKSVGLTDTEFSLLKEVALSCNDAFDAKSRAGNAEVRQLAGQKAQKSAPPPAVAVRIEALERERTKVITDCQDSLKRGMGAARYAQLYNYVPKSEGATARYIDPAKPDLNAKGVPPPTFIPAPYPVPGGLK